MKLKKLLKKNLLDFKEKILKNQICFTNNEIINFRSLSLAKTIGIEKINVKIKPKIYVILTGDELISKNNPKGKIHSSNEILINMIIEKFGGTTVDTIFER